MMSSTRTAFTELPVIDVSGLYSDQSTDRRAVAEALGRAAREVGFFYVTGHKVEMDLRKDLLEQTKRFFEQPVERKMDVYIGKSINHRGYVPEGEEVMVGGKHDRKEALDIGLELASNDPLVTAGTPMVGPNQWPDLPGFRTDVTAYYEAVFDLGRRLLHGFALALGKDETFFDDFVTKPPSQLRLLHYPYDADAEDAQGIGAHTDYECFTLLLPTAPGLQVMNGDGEWIDVPLLADAYVVNIGDMMEIWTNGAFIATSHRVRKVKEERYSFPLFFACDYHTTVAPIPDLIGDGQTANYDPVRAGDHLFSQTVQSFAYLRDRLARGEVTLPEDAKALSSFGQYARHLEAQDE
ncbi:isopenicillin N synthase family dioxygenase [Roseibium algae]|uniref:2-oxoglutarate and iron-dependent oxygenase domain-containing protein n=1 Tax=Roseibium algae TaxID=3123038 RepID=A0ABU8TRD8_9HYPH